MNWMKVWPRARRHGLAATAAAILAAACPPAIAAGEAPSGYADLLAPLLPAVVSIMARHLPNPSVPAMRQHLRLCGTVQAQVAQTTRSISDGSGFIIDPSGLILTNRHVIEGADEITVIMGDNRTFTASVVGASPCDLALLWVDTDRPLPSVRLADSETVRIGDPVVAVGNPLNLGVTVSAGVVSAIHRDIGDGPLDDFIQTDAPLNHGNSGGPLFNLKGEVIGVNTAIISPTRGSIGLGFAIPANDASSMAEMMRRDHGIVLGWIGARMQQVTPDLARALGRDPEGGGAIVASIAEGGPAAKAKLREGDIITELDGHPIKFVRHLVRRIAAMASGTTATLAVHRDGADLSLPVTVEAWPDTDMAMTGTVTAAAAPAAPRSAPSDLGLRLATLTPEARSEYRLGADQRGVVVTDIVLGTLAAESDLGVGDLIVRVGQDLVDTPQDVDARLAALRKLRRAYALMLVDSGGMPRWEPLRLGNSN